MHPAEFYILYHNAFVVFKFDFSVLALVRFDSLAFFYWLKVLNMLISVKWRKECGASFCG
jgi:hypothetical protein